MSNSFLFSIITITYNEEKRIGNTLKSVYSQSFSDYEHIIEDGFSSDNTVSIVKKVKAQYSLSNLVVYQEKDSGLYDAMNRAIKRAKGKYICFLNSGDSFYDENVLKSVADYINNYPNMDWYYGDSIVVFPNGDEYYQACCTYENISGEVDYKELRQTDIDFVHQSLFASKRCFERSLFDTTYQLRAEFAWYLDNVMKGCKVKKMNIPISCYAFGGTSDRAESAVVNRDELLRMYKEYDILTPKREFELTSDRWGIMLKRDVYNKWLALKQAGYNIEEYLLVNNYHEVAIYGYGDLGNHLINELKRSKVRVNAIIDRASRYSYQGVPFFSPEDFSEQVDAIIICAVASYTQIKHLLEKKISVPIISLDNILEEMWEMRMDADI